MANSAVKPRSPAKKSSASKPAIAEVDAESGEPVEPPPPEPAEPDRIRPCQPVAVRAPEATGADPEPLQQIALARRLGFLGR